MQITKESCPYIIAYHDIYNVKYDDNKLITRFALPGMEPLICIQQSPKPTSTEISKQASAVLAEPHTVIELMAEVEAEDKLIEPGKEDIEILTEAIKKSGEVALATTAALHND